MPALCESTGLGVYVANEAHSCLRGRLYKPATSRPIIYFTGGPGDARDYLTATASGSHIPPVLAEAGWPIVSAAFGGGSKWGNDTAISRIGSAWTQVKSQLGTETDKFVGIGSSKGMTALLNYARANPSNVAALVGLVPAVNVSDIYDNNRDGLAASIDTAYGGSWATNKATHDPALNTSTHASQAIPMRLYYGDSDTTVVPSTVTDFATAVGAEAVSVGAYGHLTANAQVPANDVRDFLVGYA